MGFLDGLVDKAAKHINKLDLGDKKQESPSSPSSSHQQPDTTPSNVSADVNSSSSNTHRALLIGINYFGTKAELKGCINDVNNIHNFLKKSHPEFTSQNIRVLTDDKQDQSEQPTRSNIEQGMRWLVSNAKPGDTFFLHYSGHGGSTADLSGDEDDSKDETILPVDFEKAGQIIDDDMHDIMLTNLPAGCKFTAIYDSCHSGSVLDLAFTYSVDENANLVKVDHRKELLKHGFSAAKNLYAGKKSEAMKDAQTAFKSFFAMQKEGKGGEQEEAPKKPKKTGNEKVTKATVVQFAGCHDVQTSADANIGGQPTGAMSWALLKTLDSHNGQISYLDLLKETRSLLHGKYTQIPQMSSGFDMDMNSKFSL